MAPWNPCPSEVDLHGFNVSYGHVHERLLEATELKFGATLTCKSRTCEGCACSKKPRHPIPSKAKCRSIVEEARSPIYRSERSERGSSPWEEEFVALFRDDYSPFMRHSIPSRRRVMKHGGSNGPLLTLAWMERQMSFMQTYCGGDFQRRFAEICDRCMIKWYW